MQNGMDCDNIRLDDDDIIEDAEEFMITLTSSGKAEFVNGTATVTILDDDGMKVLLLHKAMKDLTRDLHFNCHLAVCP